MSNSSLVSHVNLSPNCNKPRNQKIDTITIHCVAGQCSAKTVGEIFAPTSRKASSNYGIGTNGEIGMYVEEKNRSWCSSSSANDNRAITIEVASDKTHPYAVNDKAYKGLIALLVDICKRNGIKELLWRNDKKLIGQVDKQNMTLHQWFSNTACPGEYLIKKHAQIASDVNKQLKGTASTTKPKEEKFEQYKVQVTANALNVRKGPGTNYAVATCIRDKGTYTITEESSGSGAKKWGKISSGWISLDYCKRK